MGWTKSSNKLPPFVPLAWDMLNSKAYRDVAYAASKALPYFIGKYKGIYHDPQRYLLEFTFSYSEGERYGFSASTFSKVIQELVRKGFIDPVDKGGLRSDGKSYNLFKLSRRWEKYGNKDFEQTEWRCFNPRQKVKATSKNETHSFKKGNNKASDSKVISQIEAVESVSR
ncbi:MAG: hypothetical protein Q7U10_07940 [Thermodesulfovibrionia bacterium]|nr:hypothetical protein [Thermodesulfovibrionia bacterium]